MTNKDWRVSRLSAGFTFTYKGRYCTIKKIKKYHFEYDIQGSNVNGYMNYSFYTTIPSYFSRKFK